MREKFAESDFLSGVPEKLGGAICMHYDETHGRGQFLWTHTTASMGLAYQTTADANPTTVMSRINNLPLAKGAGMYILTESISFTTTKKGHPNSKGQQPCSLDSQEPTSTCEVESASAKA